MGAITADNCSCRYDQKAGWWDSRVWLLSCPDWISGEKVSWSNHTSEAINAFECQSNQRMALFQSSFGLRSVSNSNRDVVYNVNLCQDSRQDGQFAQFDRLIQFLLYKCYRSSRLINHPAYSLILELCRISTKDWSICFCDMKGNHAWMQISPSYLRRDYHCFAK
jgi:hypothetical protein